MRTEQECTHQHVAGSSSTQASVSRLGILGFSRHPHTAHRVGDRSAAALSVRHGAMSRTPGTAADHPVAWSSGPAPGGVFGPGGLQVHSPSVPPHKQPSGTWGDTRDRDTCCSAYQVQGSTSRVRSSILRERLVEIAMNHFKNRYKTNP
jgi:hypothetical protein